MGVEYHAFCFLKRAAKGGSLGSVATLGRKSVDIRPEDVEQIRRPGGHIYEVGDFCELLEHEFMASAVHSFDASSYEGATYTHDFNKPISHNQNYDTVIDFGTLEHVFNIAQALFNVSALCKSGGQIVHVLPADNCSGHGFWQLSPELFFSLYSTENGYRDTEVFLAEIRNRTCWYKVSPPLRGERVEFASRSPVYVLARTTKVQANAISNVQQSDYPVDWEEDISETSEKWPPRPASQAARPGLLRSALARSPRLNRYLKDKAFEARCLVADLQSQHYLAKNTGFRRVPIHEAIS